MGKRKIKGDKELEKIAEMFKNLGLTSGEQYRAIFQFKGYKDHYHIDSYSDLQLLSELVFREILQERCKAKIGTIDKSESVKKQKVIPVTVMRALDDNLDRMLVIREKLGLFEDKKVDDPFKYIQTLKKKYQLWREKNQGSRTFPCPHCSKMVMLKIRTDKYDAIKHPMFQDRILANVHLWKLYKEGKITKDDIAKVFGVSSDYVDYIEDKLFMNPSE